MSHHKIEAKNLIFTYPDGHKAIEDVSFLINHGESVGLLGANGAGKSTLLMLLMGVLFPSGGDVLIGDVRLTAQTLPLIRQHLGLVFQNPDNQLFMNTVHDDVAFGPQNMKLSTDEVERRVSQSLEAVNIPHLINRAPYRCSGGEKRAAAIASVLAMTPDVLILDEPTSDLDPRARRTAIELLRGFAHTKIIASHDIDMIYDVCDRVIIIQNGRIRADGKTADIVTDAVLMHNFGLEPPLCVQGCPRCGIKFV